MNAAAGCYNLRYCYGAGYSHVAEVAHRLAAFRSELAAFDGSWCVFRGENRWRLERDELNKWLHFWRELLRGCSERRRPYYEAIVAADVTARDELTVGLRALRAAKQTEYQAAKRFLDRCSG